MADPELPLSHLRVLEVATEIAGPYAGKLFADAGADVVKVEPASGDPMRRHTAGGPLPEGTAADSALFAYLNTSKRSIVGTTDDAHVRALAAAADVVIVDAAVSASEVAALRAAQPASVVVAITPFGLTGPSAGEPATEFTLQARCGSTGGRGLADRIPLAAGGRLGEWIGGAYGAVAGLAYARRAREHGAGELVDVSLLEAMLITMGGLGVVTAQIMGVAGVRNLELPSIRPPTGTWVSARSPVSNSRISSYSSSVRNGSATLTSPRSRVASGAVRSSTPQCGSGRPSAPPPRSSTSPQPCASRSHQSDHPTQSRALITLWSGACSSPTPQASCSRGRRTGFTAGPSESSRPPRPSARTPAPCNGRCAKPQPLQANPRPLIHWQKFASWI